MRFNTDVYYVKPERIFGGHTLACWKLWFTEDSDIKDRQHIIECHTFPAKPTKKQIRKLRRAFRKEAKMWTESEWVIDPFDTYEANELSLERMS